MKKIIRILAGLVFLLLAVVVVFYFYVDTLRPQYEGEVSLEGFSEDVEVYYDEYGIPHIYAQSNEDAFQALGYVHAQDRLFQMEMLRRVGSGTLSEAFGEDMIPVDKFFRITGITEHCRQSAKQFMNAKDSAWQKLAFEYVKGINQFIAVGPDPVEFKLAGLEKTPFTVEDLYFIVGYMTYSFDHALKTDPLVHDIYHRLGPNYLNDLSHHFEDWHETIDGNDYLLPNSKDSSHLSLSNALSTAANRAMAQLPIPPFRASNAWVVGPQKSKSGKVLFANDTHIGFSQPSVWYEAHLETPNLRLYGNFLAGFPYPLIGHTEHHAWGLTMFLNDDLDLYKEEIKNNQVKFNNEWVNLTERTDTILVKDGEPVILNHRVTPHGPLINETSEALKKEAPVALSWTFLDFPMEAMQVAHGFTFSKDMDEFYSHASRLAAPGLNIMYGDEDGNIGWWATAKLRKRPEHVNSKLFLNGANGNDEIQGYYSYSENPHAINPEAGYVYSANNQSISADSMIYPGYYYSGDRAKVIQTALSAKDDWDVETIQELQTYHRSPTYPENGRLLLKHIHPEGKTEQAVYDLLNQWSGSHDTADVAPTVYYKWIYHLLEQGLADDLGNQQFEELMGTFLQKRSLPKLIQNDSSMWWDNQQTDQREFLEDIAQSSWKTAVQELQQEWGNQPNQWKWGKVHQLTHKHQFTKTSPELGPLLNVGPFAVNSGDEVINKLNFALNGDKILEVLGGPAMRIAIDFDDVENSKSILPTGQSGNPLSSHYRDQAEMFAKEQWRKQKMDADEIKTEGSKRLLIKSK